MNIEDVSIGDTVIYHRSNGEERRGIVRHIGRLNNIGASNYIWSTWGRQWNGVLSSSASIGGQLKYMRINEIENVIKNTQNIIDECSFSPIFHFNKQLIDNSVCKTIISHIFALGSLYQMTCAKIKTKKEIPHDTIEKINFATENIKKIIRKTVKNANKHPLFVRNKCKLECKFTINSSQDRIEASHIKIDLKIVFAAGIKQLETYKNGIKMDLEFVKIFNEDFLFDDKKLVRFCLASLRLERLKQYKSENARRIELEAIARRKKEKDERNANLQKERQKRVDFIIKMRKLIGKKVKIKNDLVVDRFYGAPIISVLFSDGMTQYCNRVVTITNVVRLPDRKYAYKIDIDGGYFNWTAEMFDKL